MKAPAFGYIQPKTIDDALECLQQHGSDATVLAGGQSLMASLNMRLSNPAVLIDINDIDELSGINMVENQLRIGAMTRQVELEHSTLVSQHAPLITMVIPHIAHPAIRNRGTIGGSIVFADPAAELPACMVALNGQMVAQGPDGERRITATEFFQDLFETALAENELLTAIEIPVADENQRFGFRELTRRHGDYAIVGLCASSDWSSDDLTELRLAYFNVGPRPILAEQTASDICRNWRQEQNGMSLDRLDGELDPPDDLNATSAMRVHLAKVLTRRVLKEWRS
ncbi:MAG TPA: xanthine dehydrogenase family protein subunit M [Gammaproteobacteria bacterium]|nr:xanthine dehydrogenase family protein subunit M [Gammaproteobacteria bacterium]HIM98381.1 xanthine dehydrogenase family protein subunit M [Gammaproteobacteria bacterium]